MTLCAALAGGTVNADLPRLLALCALAALLITAATGALHQTSDVDVDRINDPGLPICAGEITPFRAGVFAAMAGSLAALIVLVLCATTRQWVALPMFGVLALARSLRSIRGLHLSARRWPVSTFLDGLQGLSLAAAGWSLTGSLVSPHAWLLALIAGLLWAGAGQLREVAAQRGDAAYGVATLAATAGVVRASQLAAPMMFAPFLLLPALAALKLVKLPPGQWLDALAVGACCALIGAALAARLLEEPEKHAPGLHGRFAALCALYFAAMAVAHVPYGQWSVWMNRVLWA